MTGKQDPISCDVNSDLMLLYTGGRTSPQTDALIENHMQNCAACRQAFHREPQFRGRMGYKRSPEPAEMDGMPERLSANLLPAWSFTLYLLSRTLAFADRGLRRLGVPTANLKIRLYRARRKVAGKLVRDEAPTANVV